MEQTYLTIEAPIRAGSFARCITTTLSCKVVKRRAFIKHKFHYSFSPFSRRVVREVLYRSVVDQFLFLIVTCWLASLSQQWETLANIWQNLWQWWLQLRQFIIMRERHQIKISLYIAVNKTHYIKNAIWIREVLIFYVTAGYNTYRFKFIIKSTCVKSQRFLKFSFCDEMRA